MKTPQEHERAQLRIITSKGLLGDAEAEEHLERGELVAKAHAKLAAKRLGICDCTRTDGIVCGRQLTPRAGRICWRCWSYEQDKKPCDHARKR